MAENIEVSDRDKVYLSDPIFKVIFEKLILWQMGDSGCTRAEAEELMEAEAVEQYFMIADALFEIDGKE